MEQGKMRVILTVEELAELDRQEPATKARRGWQGLIVGLQQRVNRFTREIDLDERALERIPRYAFDYKRGGWQGRLMRIFSRTLGPGLGRRPTSVAA
jgi:hypothetical protein